MRMVSWEEGQGLLRGSLTVLRRRCGSPGCHCARGELHETPVLSYKQGGKTKMLSLTAGDVAAVSAALARYREAAGPWKRRRRQDGRHCGRTWRQHGLPPRPPGECLGADPRVVLRVLQRSLLRPVRRV